MLNVASRVAQLATCPIAQVRAEWQSAVGEAAPSVPPALLRQLTAHAIQAKRWRGLSAAVERELDRIASGAGGGGSGKPPPGTPLAILPGTRLVRAWNGRTISVLASEDGFVWEDRRYASLSQIAREVTGARWSGPRFFGLPSRG